jgi:predicted amidohydrolase YtcJ
MTNIVPDLVLYNGRVYSTTDQSATSVAIKNGRIFGLGRSNQFNGKTKTIDLKPPRNSRAQ